MAADPFSGQAPILYDADCGFCCWSLAKVLAWDRRRALRPVPLQDPEAERLLSGMDAEQRMASWHLAAPDGHVYSAGTAAAPLLRLLPGGAAPAAVCARFPRAVDRLYAWAARNRAPLGRPLSTAAIERARHRIRARSRTSPGPGQAAAGAGAGR
jgi:predicted DCC family thiol-disulfide oxidoreductase YuxK